MFCISNIYSLLEEKGLCVQRNYIIKKITFLGKELFVCVFNNGRICFIFNGKQYLFEDPFGKYLSGTFQLFVQDNIVVLLSELMLVSFVFENQFFSKIEFKPRNEWPYKLFVESNTIVLCIRRMILSFTLENGTFTKRYYPIRHGIDNGILILDKGTLYFVCCIHPLNCDLITVSINLFTGQQNNVLEMGEDEHFNSFQINNGRLSITTTSGCCSITSLVNPQKINNQSESWRQDGGIIWENLLKNITKKS